MKASELRDLIGKRIEEYGDFDVRYDGCNIKDVEYRHEFFTNKYFEIET